MKGILKNEFIKLFERREIVILLVASLFLPLFICLALTAGEKEDLAKYIDLPGNYYQNRISAAERLLEQTNPDYSSEAAVLLKEIKLCELLQTKDIFSTYTWQFTIAELSLRAGFDEEASEAIKSDDYRYYYDKLIALSPVESKKDLFKKLKALDVYPDYTDYRYLLALRISDDADTPEDKLLLHRIENDMPERPVRGSYHTRFVCFFVCFCGRQKIRSGASFRYSAGKRQNNNGQNPHSCTRFDSCHVAFIRVCVGRRKSSTGRRCAQRGTVN